MERCSLRSPAARGEWRRIDQTRRPREEWLRSLADCCHEAPPSLTVLAPSSLRACGLGLLARPKHKCGYVMCRPVPFPAGAGAPRSSGPRRLIAIRSSGPVTSHNRALCYLTRLPVTVLATDQLDVVRLLPSTAPVSRRILHASNDGTRVFGMSGGVALGN